MNSIDMRFSAIFGIGNIGVENMQTERLRGEKNGRATSGELRKF